MRLILFFVLSVLSTTVGLRADVIAWFSVAAPVNGAITKVVHADGQFVALVPLEPGGSAIIRSSAGESWEPSILAENLLLTDLVHGPGRFLAVGSRGGQAAVLVSDDAGEWILVEAFPELSVPIVAAAHALGHFWAIPETGDLYFSLDGEEWTATARGPVRQLLAEHDGKLISVGFGPIHTGTWSGTGNVQWTSVAAFSGEGFSVARGEDRVVVPWRNGVAESLAVSGDGDVWLAFDHPGPPLNNVVSAGGRFFALAPGKVFSSADGVRWADRSAGLNGAGIRSVARGNGVLVAVGDDGAVFLRPAGLEPAIINQPAGVVVAREGQPLALAVEADGDGELSYAWERNGAALEASEGPQFRVSSSGPGDAGTYTLIVSNIFGHASAAAMEVTMEAAGNMPVPWENVATARGDLARIATGERGVLAFVPASSFAVADFVWSADGAHWRTGRFSTDSAWEHAGSVRGQLWLAGGGANGGAVFSDDGILWRRHSFGGAHVVLAGEHEENLFVVGGNGLWFSADGATWVYQSGPTAEAGGYVSTEKGLVIAGQMGLSRWNGTVWENLGMRGGTDLLSGFRLPRFASDGQKAFWLNRDYPSSSVAFRSLEEFTRLVAVLPEGRDVILTNNELFSVGNRFAHSSTDGIWWADRSAGLPLIARLNACAPWGDSLYAVGERGRIFRRPAALEPAFYQHPRSMAATPGQPVRLVGRTTGGEDDAYQWYLDGEPIAGANSSVLELPAVEAEQAGTYTLVATNSVGSTSSTPGVLTVQSAPLANPWTEIGRFPVSTSHKALPGRIVSGNGMLLGPAHGDGTVLASQDGNVWVRVHLPNGALQCYFVDGRFFAADSNGRTLISEDGLFWRDAGLNFSLRRVAAGEGVFVATTSVGPRWSIDFQNWWSLGGSPEFSLLAYGNGRFIGVGSNCTIWTSENGRDWQEGVRPSSPLTTNPVAVAFADDVFLVAAYSFETVTLNRTTDGITWQGWQTAPLNVPDLYVHGADFWMALHASSDGSRWVNRMQGGALFHFPVHLARADLFDIIAMSGERLFRRSALLDPVIHPFSPQEQAVSPGGTFRLEAPEAHGSGPFSYEWLKNGETIAGAGEPAFERSDASRGDGGTYTVRIFNASGAGTAEVDLRYLDRFGEWASHYRIGNQMRSAEDDPGGQGIPNLLRYALHLDPVQPERADLPRMEIEEHEGQPHAVFNFQLLHDSHDVRWRVEASPDLVNWQPLEGAVIAREHRSGSIRHLTIRDSEPLPPGGRRFMRLHAALEPEVD